MSKNSIADYAEKNNIKEIKRLLEAGVNINEYEYDKTALHTACVSTL